MLYDLAFAWGSSLYPAYAHTKPMEQPTAQAIESIVDAQQAAQPVARAR